MRGFPQGSLFAMFRLFCQLSDAIPRGELLILYYFDHIVVLLYLMIMIKSSYNDISLLKEFPFIKILMRFSWQNSTELKIRMIESPLAFKHI